MSVATCLCSASKPAPSSTASTASSTASAPAVAATSTTGAAVKPESLAGDWLFEVTRSGEPVQYSLHFSVAEGVLAGSLTGPNGGARELTRIAVKDDKVSWDIEGDRATLHYEGSVTGTSMKGTIKTSRARRQSGQSGDSGDGSEGSAGTTPGNGGYRAGGMRGGRGGRGGRRAGASQQTTWSAYKSVAPIPGEGTGPEPTPTPASSGSSGQGDFASVSQAASAASF